MISFPLVAVFSRLQVPETRQAAAIELAAHFNTDQVLVFGKDEEIGVFLPAVGLQQTFRQGYRWQHFLNHSLQAGTAQCMLPAPQQDGDIPALGIADSLGLSIMVFLGPAPNLHDQACASAMLPLLGAKLAIERDAFAAHGHATAARNANKTASDLNAALEASRQELQMAYQRAENELVFRRQAEQKLLEADRRKDEFLAMLAHELRNPLAPISTAAQILKLAPQDALRVQQTSKVIERQVRHMTSLLNDLLDVSRVTRGLVTIDKTPLDMQGIVSDAVEQVRPLIEMRGHRLSLSIGNEPATILGDRTRLVQILANLLNNAAKYTPEGGEIALRLATSPTRITLTVTDTGIGIEPELLPRVFELFTQGTRSSDRTQGGLGVGLALVSSLVRLHDGTVTAASRGTGMGSEFVVQLPRFRQPPLPPSLTEAPACGAPGKKPRVLIIDDNIDAAQTLATYLQAIGHAVDVLHNAGAALETVNAEPPAAMLIDIGLPDMDGYQLAGRLRGQAQTADVVLIALTGYGQPEDIERSRAAGFDYHLTKPTDITWLSQLLANLGGADYPPRLK